MTCKYIRFLFIFCLLPAMTPPLHAVAGLQASGFRISENSPDTKIVLEFSPPETLDARVCSAWIQVSDTAGVKMSVRALDIVPVPSGERPVKTADIPVLADASEIVTVSPPMIFRSLRVCRVSVFPRWISQKDQICRKVRHATIIVEMKGVSHINPLYSPPPITVSYDAFYRHFILNYAPEKRVRDDQPERYLIFTSDAYEPRLQGFIAWKEEEGFRVDIMRRSELPAWPAPADLKNALQAVYDSGDPPVYVLFCGDENVTPIFYSYDPTHPGDYADDHYYAMLAGDDLLPDIVLSRLPAENGEEVSTMLNKIMKYELTPQAENPQFYTTAIMAASHLVESQVTTKEQTWERLETYCGYVTAHKYYDWDETTLDAVLNAINAGASVINYRGEGWRQGWNPLHEYWFNYDNLDSLANLDVTPFVTSIGCGVSMFDTPEECWSHKFMALGSPESAMGAVAIIGPTWNTHTTYDNWLDRGIYRGYVFSDLCRAGQMMDYGKLYVIDQFPNPEDEEYVDEEVRTFLLFGTPDMWVRMGPPREVVAGLAFGYDSMARYISLSDTGGEFPTVSLVSYACNGQRKVATPDENGGIPLEIDPGDSSSVHVVVNGKNLIPLFADLPLAGPGDAGRLVITEIKPDIPADGENGDMVELFNADDSAIDLRGWILSDLDGYDIPFVTGEAVLEPGQLAVIVLAGSAATETIEETPYGLRIVARENPDFSSMEDVATLRDPMGRVVDSLAWHDNSGTGSTNVAGDLSRVTPSNSPLEILTGGWWNGPDTVTQENYEANAVDWSVFAGNGGEGSIQRVSESFPDGPGNFIVRETTGFGEYYHPPLKRNIRHISRRVVQP